MVLMRLAALELFNLRILFFWGKCGEVEPKRGGVGGWGWVALGWEQEGLYVVSMVHGRVANLDLSKVHLLSVLVSACLLVCLSTCLPTFSSQTCLTWPPSRRKRWPPRWNRRPSTNTRILISWQSSTRTELLAFDTGLIYDSCRVWQSCMLSA